MKNLDWERSLKWNGKCIVILRVLADLGILYAHCFNRWFLIYFKMFAGNRNNILAFRETMEEFFTQTEYEWQVLITNSGPYSLQNMENIRFKRIVRLFERRSI